MQNPRLHTRFAVNGVTGDQLATCERLLERSGSGRLMLLPTHHVNQEGDLSGFCYRCAGSAPGSALPIPRKMFFGHTAVECLDDEATIADLLRDPARNRRIMKEFLGAPRGGAALLDCMPDNSDVMTESGIFQGTGLRTVDCKSWDPELPDVLGVYHAYLRGFTRETRTHKTYLICTGGLDKACDEFCNMLVDLGDKWTAGEIAISEEAWWLRRACSRARCCVLKELADAFGLTIPNVQDIYSHHPRSVAVPSIETMMHDLSTTGTIGSEGTVSVFNECMDTTRPFNGILACMHPAEGYWLFKGSKGATPFGSTFGDVRRCGVFPVRQPVTPPHRNSVLCSGKDPCVVYHNGPREQAHYQCFDETFLKTLELTDWDRNNGIVEFMPLVVGVPYK